MREEISDKLKDEKFLRKIINMETPEEVRKAFKEENIDISDEELKEVGKDIYSLLEEFSRLRDSKLSDEEAEKVSGGFFLTVGAVVAITGSLANVASNYYNYRSQLARAEATGNEVEIARLNSSWKGMISNNPGYAAATAAVLGISTAYVAKAFISGIKDGSLKRWFNSSDQSAEEFEEE